MFVEEAVISLRRRSWGTVCYCLSSGFLKATKQNQWPSGVTDPGLLIFKHGDGWVSREGAGEGRGDGGQTGRGERMTKWQRRALVVARKGFREIKTDRQTERPTKGGKDGGRDQWDERRPPQM